MAACSVVGEGRLRVSATNQNRNRTCSVEPENTTILMKTPHSLILTAVVLAAASPAALAITATESAQILYLKQEEKLARDVYQVLSAKWSLPAFARIAAAEQTHMTAVDGLIARYGLKDTTPAEIGRFSIPELQSLYDQLVAAGGGSLAEALQVGVKIEEADIADLEEVLAATREAAMVRVFSNLLQGSKNHLRAFTSLADGTATGLGAAGAGSCQQPCAGQGMMGQGRGRGQGQGKGQGQGLGAGKGNCTGMKDCTAAGAGAGACVADGVCPAGQDPASCTGGNCPLSGGNVSGPGASAGKGSARGRQ